MDTNLKALEISELLPRRGRPGKRNRSNFIHGSHVLVGDHEYIWLCEKLYDAVIDHNWHSQHGYISFTDGEKFWYYNQKINGKKASLFRPTGENLGILERKNYQNKITNWVTTASASTGDLIAVADLILESVGKEKAKQRRVLGNSKWWPMMEKSYRDVATKQILRNLNRLSVRELKDIWECINCHVCSPEREAISKAA